MAKVMDQPLSEEANGCNSDSEEINKLFPRCRPRSGGPFPPLIHHHTNNNNNFTPNGCSDFNQNSLLSASSGSSTLSMDKVNDNYPNHRPGSGQSEDPPPPAVAPPAEDHSVISGYDYCDYEAKDEDSPESVGYPGFCRIEIAGGREIFSKSRSKAAKKRHEGEGVVPQRAAGKDPNKRFSADVMYDDKLRRYMYNMSSPSGSVEKLHMCSSSSKYNRTADPSFITEEEGEEKVRTNGRLKKSTSARALDAKHLVYEAPVSNAEVVYDDIGELMDQRKVSGRNGLHVKDFSSPPYPIEVLESPGSDTAELPPFRLPSSSHHGGKAPHIDVSSPVSSSHYGSGGLWGSLDGAGEEEEMMMMEEEEMETDSEPVSPVKQGIARLIGNVPIAEYEGSPRRYGPRPGYPHRVTTENGGEKLPSTCEELLQVIAGNKPLCNNSSGGESPPPPAESDFNDLDYRLYRVNTGSSVVGRRLAASEDSPQREAAAAAAVNGDGDEEESAAAAAFNEQELLLLHESVHQHTTRLLAASDLDSLPGTETEVGEQVGEHTRNFTLSPETTDCDSNDVESDVASLEGPAGCMPVLEDGLSSGRSSGDEDEGLLLGDKQQQSSGGEVAEYLWRYSCNSQHLNLQDVDLSYFDVLSQKSGGEAGRSDNGEECPNGKHVVGGGGTVSDAIKEIKQAIQMSKNVQLKNTHAGNNCDGGPNQPVWVPRSSHPSKSKEGCHSEGHNEKNPDEEDCDTDQETDRLLGAQRTDDKGFYDDKARNSSGKKKSTSKEVLIHEPAVLIEGVLFRARYLGSTQLVCEGQPTKATRMMQAEEAVSRIKHNPARIQLAGKNDAVKGDSEEPYTGSEAYASTNDVEDRVEQMKISLCPHSAPEGETQPSTEVDLFISTEKIMVLNTDLKEIMMDHALRAISYIADIGDLVVLMARRRVMNSPDDLTEPKIKRTPKMICHVFESEEAQFIAQSIGQAFQVAYMEFLKANGIEDSSFVKEMDYQEVLNSQEIFGNELEMFAKKEKQKEVVVPKQKGEILGMVIVESGWGSMLPTVVIANMAQSGPAARCGQLNIGDQIIAINGISLVGLPLSTCQNYIKNTKNQTVVKLTVVPCAPVVEVKIKRPDTKYQLGFSVQNGVICSLLRGGIAERGGVRVGHRIIEINGQSVVAVPHEKIVNLLATSVGEIHMKTMPTSMFRLLTGQESPLYI